MLHILVKWIKEDSWDVYPLRHVADPAIGLDITNDPKGALQRLHDVAVDVMWKAGEAPAPAKILAVGSRSSMEKKRTRLESSSMESQQEMPESEVAELKRKNNELQEENEELKQANCQLKYELQQARDSLDAAKMVKRLKRMMDSYALPESTTVVPAPTVDLGNGVLIDEGTLARTKADAKNSGTKFARSLLRALFTPEECAGKSLYGKKSNAHKDVDQKEPLDQVRVDVIIGYTIRNFDVGALHVKNTLASLLARGF